MNILEKIYMSIISIMDKYISLLWVLQRNIPVYFGYFRENIPVYHEFYGENILYCTCRKF